MRNEAKLWDRHARGYSKRPIKDMASYERTLERTRKHLTKKDAVLEVGCGTGSTALLLADNTGHITASDISANMIEIAKGKAIDQRANNVTFVQATPFDKALEAEPYDTVLAFNFLHLVEDVPAVLRRISALMKPGGVIVSKTICLSESGWMPKLLIPVLRGVGIAPYVNFLTTEDLEKSFADANFEILESGNIPVSKPNRFIVARKPAA